MKNLELVKLSSKELRATNGGLPWGQIIRWTATAVFTAYEIASADLNKLSNEASEGFSAGYDAAE